MLLSISMTKIELLKTCCPPIDRDNEKTCAIPLIITFNFIPFTSLTKQPPNLAWILWRQEVKKQSRKVNGYGGERNVSAHDKSIMKRGVAAPRVGAGAAEAQSQRAGACLLKSSLDHTSFDLNSQAGIHRHSRSHTANRFLLLC